MRIDLKSVESLNSSIDAYVAAFKTIKDENIRHLILRSVYMLLDYKKQINDQVKQDESVQLVIRTGLSLDGTGLALDENRKSITDFSKFMMLSFFSDFLAEWERMAKLKKTIISADAATANYMKNLEGWA